MSKCLKFCKIKLGTDMMYQDASLKSSRNLTLGTCDRVYLVVDRHSKSAKAYMSLYYMCDMYSHFGNPRMSLILRSPFSRQLLA